MIAERRLIEIGGIAVEILRKDIRSLRIAVYPPFGGVRVSAPLHCDDKTIHSAVVSRLDWIRRHRERYARQGCSPAAELVTGESHYVEGRAYCLRVVEEEGRCGVRIEEGATLVLSVPRGADRTRRAAALEDWYRRRLGERIPVMIRRWEPVIEVSVAEWRVRRMRTRWGSCNIAARRIWLNLDLAWRPVACLEYVLVHEMVHLLERRHNRRFYSLMDRFLPDWRRCRDELNGRAARA